jgi:hypothetical protein
MKFCYRTNLTLGVIFISLAAIAIPYAILAPRKVFVGGVVTQILSIVCYFLIGTLLLVSASKIRNKMKEEQAKYPNI